MSVGRFIGFNAVFLAVFAFILFYSIIHLQPTSPSFRHRSLYLRDDGSFDILIFSDLHFGEEEHGWGIAQDRKSLAIMNGILDAEDPDFVVINGDLITGENTFRENASSYVDQVVAPLVSRDIPWASTYGNHDSSYNLSREALYESESRYPLSHTQYSDKALGGVTNYHIEVLDRSGRAALILWFLDSQGGSLFQTKGNQTQTEIPGVVSNATVDWLTETHQQLIDRHGRVLPSLLFVHIPPRLFAETQTSKSFAPARFPGLNKDYPLSTQHGLGLTDSRLVDALLSLEGLHSIHSGHDHGASWCASRQRPARKIDQRDHGSDAPIFLCFAHHTGQGGYGDWTRGARMLRVTVPEMADGSGDGGHVKGKVEVESWVRLQSMQAISRVSLNETYGQDEYPLEDVE
ncbi:putative inactive purple acid phosphatase 16 [Ceratocystis fimbriata CBS 114723]|uniref:Putative inactive purple acid phosphatase 16 n=1 Tax=Ceratocystis fimbriata CBS 114723 TaxID=1035309 RepID=A0A2C5X3Q8_9PEZI|nr:putative inactive purple acid phosphatase 16 [Ceratocystis fimbriata CBS 114723]